MISEQYKPKACVNPNWPKECPMVKDGASVCKKDCFYICTICDKGYNKKYAYSLQFLCEEHKQQVINEFEKREGVKLKITTGNQSSTIGEEK